MGRTGEAGISQAPKTWSQFAADAARLNTRSTWASDFYNSPQQEAVWESMVQEYGGTGAEMVGRGEFMDVHEAWVRGKSVSEIANRLALIRGRQPLAPAQPTISAMPDASAHAARFRLDGRVALVTGAGSERGIGRATAALLAEAGAQVALADLDVEGARRNAQQLTGSAMGVALDVLDPGSITSAVSEVRALLGRVTILVNGAGITRSRPIDEIPIDEYEAVMGVNVRGGLLCLQAVLPDMKAEGWGRVIWLSSIAGKQGGGVFGSAHYAASKAAVIGLCQAAARELGAFGITSNAIAPGLVMTGLVAAASSPEREAEIESSVIAGTPLRRAAQASDVAAAALFLASDEAGYVTGEILDVNGGAYFD